MRQVYELNLPPIQEILIDDFSWYNDDHMRYNYIWEDDISKVVKPEWHHFLNINWSSIIYFKKKSMNGSIHCDAVNDIKDLNGKLPTIWGINWVYESKGIMKFWYWNNVRILGITTGSLNKPELGNVGKFIPLTQPDEIYILEPNKAYLVNASIPHQAGGMGNRKVFSYRSNLQDIEWDEIVKKFSDFIVNHN